MSPVFCAFPRGASRTKHFPYFTIRLGLRPLFWRARAREVFIAKPDFAASMPAKNMCADCGMKNRGPAHLCDPMRLAREKRRKAALAKLTQK